MNEVREILEQRGGGLPRLLTFDEVKRGDLIKCLEGMYSGHIIKVRNRKLKQRWVKFIHHSPTGGYLCTISDCNLFELIERA